MRSAIKGNDREFKPQILDNSGNQNAGEQLAKIIYKICGPHGSSIDRIREISDASYSAIHGNDNLGFRRMELLDAGMEICKKKIIGKTADQLKGFRFHIEGLVQCVPSHYDDSDGKDTKLSLKLKRIGKLFNVRRVNTNDAGTPSLLNMLSNGHGSELELGLEALTRLILIGFAR